MLVGDTVLVGDLPVHQAQHGRNAKVRAELDLHGFRALLTGHAITHCFIERVAARPRQGTVSMFRLAKAAGSIYGLVVGLGSAVSFVTPQQWQKHHQVGASPDAARQRAVQLYPDLASMLTRKRDEHRAECAAAGLLRPPRGSQRRGPSCPVREGQSTFRFGVFRPKRGRLRDG